MESVTDQRLPPPSETLSLDVVWLLAQKLDSLTSVRRQEKQIGDGLKEALGERLADLSYVDGLSSILEAMPKKSLRRDEVLSILINSRYTTWEDLEEVRQLFVLPPDETPENDNTPNIPGNEVIRFVKALTPETKVSILKHITNGLLKFHDLDSSKSTTDAGSLEMEELKRKLLGYLQLSTSQERLSLVGAFLSGENGLFSDNSFEKFGKQLLTGTIEASMRLKNPTIDATTFSEDEIQIARQAITTLFNELSPKRRTEVLSKFIDGIVKLNGDISREQIIRLFMDSFGLIGGKLGQLDVVIPPSLRSVVSYMKEDIPTPSKLIVARDLIQDGRREIFDGLGWFLGGGTTATAILARRKNEETDDIVIKSIRPEVMEYADEDLKATEAAFRSVLPFLDNRIDIDAIFRELVQMIAEEVDLSYESSNIRVINFFRRKHGSTIKSPEVTHRGKTHVEMSLVSGVSLVKVEDVQNKIRNGTPLSPAEQKLASINIKSIYKRIVEDFFLQAFKAGAIHTDLHQGNIFINPEDESIHEIDYGQTAIEDSSNKRDALLLISLGLTSSDITLLAQGLSPFSRIAPKEIEAYLTASNEPLLSATTKFLSQNKVRGSVIRYMKAIANILPYIQELDFKTQLEITLPYLQKPKLWKKIMKSPRGLIAYSYKNLRDSKSASVNSLL